MFNFNSLYKQGYGHNVCQDYARIFSDDNSTVGLLSDGCSSSADTDVGARLLVLNAGKMYLKNLNNINDGSTYISSIANFAAAFSLEKAASFGLSDRSLDASLCGIIENNGRLFAFVYGDGYIILKNKQQDYKFMYGFHYTTETSNTINETPVYPIYNYQNISLNNINGKIDEWILYPNKEHDRLFENRIDVKQKAFVISLYSDDIELLAVASDGIATFKNTQLRNVLDELFDVKISKGRYLDRHYNFLSKKDQHYDDLSIVCAINRN